MPVVRSKTPSTLNQCLITCGELKNVPLFLQSMSTYLPHRQRSVIVNPSTESLSDAVTFL